jgi:hypothetical protein
MGCGEVMSRTDWYVGLNERGKKMVEGMRRVEICKFEGAFYNLMPLFAYYDDKGFCSREPMFIEFIQEEPWASGPHFFIALQNTHGYKFEGSLWTEDEIDALL